MDRVNYELIKTDAQLKQYCLELADATSIAFDTEFVSENTYRPELCLIQIAANEKLVVIDPLGIEEVGIFWKALVAPGHETIVHAGREELCFCLDSQERGPTKLFDVQLAAGLVGYEYPAGYGNLTERVIGKKPHKAETRTDWRRRPLSKRQIEYALDDVRYLEAIRNALGERLESMGRTDWLTAEMQRWQDSVKESRSDGRWRRVSGSSGLSPRSLAIVRELWLWRDAEACRLNRPPRRVLRDDLIVELARRRDADVRQIKAIRGLDRGGLQAMMPALSASIQKALDLPDAECPRPQRRETNQQSVTLGQFLATALGSISRQAQIAPSLVGTVEDVRDLIADRLGERRRNNAPPSLTQGWRAEVVGQVLDNVLQGKTSIRIVDPRSERPLVFEPVVEGKAGEKS